jgi:hypothetical protein
LRRSDAISILASFINVSGQKAVARGAHLAENDKIDEMPGGKKSLKNSYKEQNPTAPNRMAGPARNP